MITSFAMSAPDPFKARTLKRKNVKGLALNAVAPKAPAPSDGDAQIPGAVGNRESNRDDTLEIGLEFRLDLKSEDLVVLKELGAGNGGTVSKVMHAGTKVVMARKVCIQQQGGARSSQTDLNARSFVSMPKRPYASRSCENYKLAMIATTPTLSSSTVLSRMKQGTLCYAWNTWTQGEQSMHYYLM